MAARTKPYESFGPFILFKKLETDALGDLWRAGRIDGSQLGPTVALRRLIGGHRTAVSANAEMIAQLLPRLNGPSFVRDQVTGVVDGMPYLTHDYAGGRSLRHIIDRARGGANATPNPLPLDQAIVIAEKVALSLATLADMRDTSGQRLSHGALVPQFIWISDDGEIRVAGQQLGTAMQASLGEAKFAAEFGRYFSPESRNSTQPAKNGDVYSLGAILFLLVTGQEPPDAATASAFASAVRAAKTMNGAAIPDDIRTILDKSFNLDPSMRYASIGEMKQAISALANGGKYSASTFNLAFYLSNLLKKEMESEAIDREKEAKVNVAPYLVPAEPYVPTPAPAMFAAAEAAQAQPRSRMPLVIAAVLIAGGVGAGAFMMMKKAPAQTAASQTTNAQLISTKPAVQPAQRVISEPIVASATPQSALANTTSADPNDPEAQKKAFEEAVRLKMQAEMMKLQAQYMAELKQKQSKNAPVQAAAPPVQIASAAPQEDRSAISAAQLDAQRRDNLTARQQPQETTSSAAPSSPVQTQQASLPQTQAAAPAVVQPQVAAVREGDVVDVAALDTLPRPLRPIRPSYPPIAAQQRISATIILTAFITESGEVADVKVLRGDPRFGLNDAAIRAIRATRFSSPMKDGKRVRTWFPQTIDFRP